MANKYLDENGLSHFWDKIKAKFADKSTDIIASITRSSTTFTAKNANGDSLFTFTQQDNTVSKTSTTPKVDGTAAIGSETKYAAGDHVHPTDTSRAPLASPTFTGTPAAPTATAGTNTTQIATTAFVTTAVSDATVPKTSTTPKANGTAAIGSENKYAAGDHVHPLQTTVSGNAGTATTLKNSRNIDGVSFNGSANIIHFGTCSVSPSTSAKTVSLTGFSLETGAWVAVKFTSTDSYSGYVSSPTLNVNSTGAKSIIYKGVDTTIPQEVVSNDRVLFMVYDGTSYNVIGSIKDGDAVPYHTIFNNNNNVVLNSKQLNIKFGSNMTASYESSDNRVLVNSSYPSTMSQSEATTGTATTGRIISPKVLHDTISGWGGIANGFAPLNSSSKIDSTYLPSYVDDVIEAYAVGSTPLAADWLSLTASGSALTPETGKIYILMVDSGNYSANSQFRWSGTTYVKLNDGGMSAITNAEIDAIAV